MKKPNFSPLSLLPLIAACPPAFAADPCYDQVEAQIDGKGFTPSVRVLFSNGDNADPENLGGVALIDRASGKGIKLYRRPAPPAGLVSPIKPATLPGMDFFDQVKTSTTAKTNFIDPQNGVIWCSLEIKGKLPDGVRRVKMEEPPKEQCFLTPVESHTTFKTTDGSTLHLVYGLGMAGDHAVSLWSGDEKGPKTGDPALTITENTWESGFNVNYGKSGSKPNAILRLFPRADDPGNVGGAPSEAAPLELSKFGVYTKSLRCEKPYAGFVNEEQRCRDGGLELNSGGKSILDIGQATASGQRLNITPREIRFTSADGKNIQKFYYRATRWCSRSSGSEGEQCLVPGSSLSIAGGTFKTSKEAYSTQAELEIPNPQGKPTRVKFSSIPPMAGNPFRREVGVTAEVFDGDTPKGVARVMRNDLSIREAGLDLKRNPIPVDVGSELSFLRSGACDAPVAMKERPLVRSAARMAAYPPAGAADSTVNFIEQPPVLGQVPLLPPAAPKAE